VKNNTAKLLDKARKAPEKQRSDLTEALILLKQLQLYDNCMQQPGCVPDWLQAIRKSSTATHHGQGELPEMISISDDIDNEIIDADSAVTSTGAIDSTEPVYIRAKLELFESCDDDSSSVSKLDSSSHNGNNNTEVTRNGHMTTDGNSNAAGCDNVLTSQCMTNMMVMTDVNSLGCSSQQIETTDAATHKTVDTLLADTNADSSSLMRTDAETSVIQRDCGNSNINPYESSESTRQTESASASTAVTTATAADDSKQLSSAVLAKLEIDESNYSHDSVAFNSTKTDTSIGTSHNVVITSPQSDTTCNLLHGDCYGVECEVITRNQKDNRIAELNSDGITANEVSNL
jgi:hypothetical protein